MQDTQGRPATNAQAYVRRRRSQQAVGSGECTSRVSIGVGRPSSGGRRIDRLGWRGSSCRSPRPPLLAPAAAALLRSARGCPRCSQALLQLCLLRLLQRKHLGGHDGAQLAAHHLLLHQALRHQLLRSQLHARVAQHMHRDAAAGRQGVVHKGQRMSEQTCSERAQSSNGPAHLQPYAATGFARFLAPPWQRH